ncbi:hypothetical protein BC940DRAFT_358428 [Gongronella butleri]|nr:hypothetical protein BC940DRAFT_358428 [Gongronella butleri]
MTLDSEFMDASQYDLKEDAPRKKSHHSSGKGSHAMDDGDKKPSKKKSNSKNKGSQLGDKAGEDVNKLPVPVENENDPDHRAAIARWALGSGQDLTPLRPAAPADAINPLTGEPMEPTVAVGPDGVPVLVDPILGASIHPEDDDDPLNDPDLIDLRVQAANRIPANAIPTRGASDTLVHANFKKDKDKDKEKDQLAANPVNPINPANPANPPAAGGVPNVPAGPPVSQQPVNPAPGGPPQPGSKELPPPGGPPPRPQPKRPNNPGGAQPAKPSLPPGSDLAALGQIGVFQSDAHRAVPQPTLISMLYLCLFSLLFIQYLKRS